MDQHTMLICRTCGREFASREQLDKHAETEHQLNGRAQETLPRYSARTRADEDERKERSESMGDDTIRRSRR